MIKKITAAALASLLTITGCSTTGFGTASKAAVNPNADCLSEVTRLDALNMSADEKSEMMFEYWRSEVDVIRPFVRAASLRDELPESWRSDFERQAEKQFSQAFTTACIVSGTSFREASLEASSYTDVWIDMVINELEKMIAEETSTVL